MFIVLNLGLLQSIGGSSFSAPSTLQPQSTVANLPEYAFVLVDRDEYILDVSDVLRTTIEGGLSAYLFSCGVLPTEMCAVTVDGFINVSGIGSVDVAGTTINEAQVRLDALVRQYYSSSLNVTLTLHQSRYCLVRIRGMVRNPGEYILSATSRASQLVYASGGVIFYGSHLGYAITREGDSLMVDLSQSRETNEFVSDPYLSNLQVVEMYPCSNPVFVNSRGAMRTVEVPPNGIGLTELLYGFDIIRGDVNLEQSMIFTHDNQSVPLWNQTMGFAEWTVLPFDTLNMAYQDEAVFVSGAVNTPGMVPFNPTSRVSWYIQAAGGYQSEANRTNVVVTTPSGIVEDFDLDTYVIQPNSTIEVKYNWITASKDYILLSMTAVSFLLAVINLSQ